MIATKENKIFEKMLKKGNGSILKAVRVDKGCGLGLIAGGIVFLVFGLMLGLPFGLPVFGIFAIPALLLFGIGFVLKKKRDTSWMSYYQDNYGFTEAELKEIDKELASSSVSLVTCKSPNAAKENFIYAFITENYVLINGVSSYIKRLEDIIAVAFSDSTDQWCLVSLTKQDSEVMAIPLFTDTSRKKELCREVIGELHRRNPNILCGQQILCGDRVYILERDSAEILRLYNEGRDLRVV